MCGLSAAPVFSFDIEKQGIPITLVQFKFEAISMTKAVLLLVSLCITVTFHNPVIIDYERQHLWSGVCGLPESRRQSPIDLPSVIQLQLCPKGVSMKFTINDTSFSLDPAINRDLRSQFVNKSTISFTNSSGTTNYYSLQFHWHSSSEHTINGQRYPLELHIVHAAPDADRYAVMAVLFEEDPELEHDDFDAIDFFKKYEDPQTFPFGIKDRMISNYWGSFTTPGCDEKVNWFVNRDITKIKTANLKELIKYIDHGRNNNRKIQPLKGREVNLIGSRCSQD